MIAVSLDTLLIENSIKMVPPSRGKKKPKDGPKLEGHKDGPKFLVVKCSEESQSFTSVSPFFIQKGVKSICGEPLSVKKLRNGSLLVQTKSISQANQFLKSTAMFELPIVVSEHIALNQTRGIVTCADLRNASLEEIQEELKDQGVCKVEYLQRKRNGKLEITNSFIVTFNASELPEKVKAAFHSLPVRAYIPRPMRCYRCQYFGHSGKSCTRDEVCSNCCVQGHKSVDCTNKTLCRNCNSTQHPSWSNTCPVFSREQEIQRIRTVRKLPYYEARRLYTLNNPLEHSFSKVVSSNVDISNNQISHINTSTLESNGSYIQIPHSSFNLVVDSQFKQKTKNRTDKQNDAMEVDKSKLIRSRSPDSDDSVLPAKVLKHDAKMTKSDVTEISDRQQPLSNDFDNEL